MFGRDPLLPLTKLLRPKLRYLGNEESILSLESLQNIYQLVVTNLKIARKKRQPSLIVDSKLKGGDLVLIKNHTAKAFQPRFKGNFRDWQLASELHPNLALYKTAKISDQVTATTQATSMITAEIAMKSIKLKQD